MPAQRHGSAHGGTTDDTGAYPCDRPDMRRLCTVPGVGPVTAGAILAFAPDLRAFKSGRNFAAWLGLVPRQHSTGGKTRLGGVSKMGQTDIRKLLHRRRHEPDPLDRP